MYESLVILTLLINIAGDFLDRHSAIRADAYSLALWTTIIQFLLIMPLIGLVNMMGTAELVICAIVGMLSALGRIPWFLALARGESLSKLSPFQRMSSVIVLLMAFLLLGEEFTLAKGLGGFIIIFGAILIGFEHPSENLKHFIRNNHGALLVIVFAASSAMITVMYKYLLNLGVAILSIYFFLKLFQMLMQVGLAVHNGTLMNSYNGITDFRLFVTGRLLQTIAALIYLLALQNLDLSIVQPIAALSPLLLFGIEWALVKLQKQGIHIAGMPEPGVGKTRVTTVRLTAIITICIGIFIMQLD